MCEIFPEVETCCGVASVRVGMILIAVLSITTGAVTLGVVEQKTNINYDKIMLLYKNVSNYTKPEQALADLPNIISTTITFMAVIFMFAGLVLLFATFADQEGFAQIFVWLIFFNIVVGFIVILAITFECLWFGSKCIIGNMDWFSASTTLLGFASYLFVWFYFCCVANSYVLNAYT